MLLSGYDLLLLVAVTALGTVSAYIRDPQVKAGMATIPIPFACAWLAVGAPVDTSNALAQFLVVAYAHAVRGLHDHLKVPIVPAIGLSVMAYSVTGAVLFAWVPHSDTLFWGLNFLAVLVGFALFFGQNYQAGTPYRTPLPVPYKAGAIAGVLVFLITIKKALGGFATLFPMMGSITSYESRYSLKDQCRQLSIFLAAGPALLAPMRYTQVVLGWSKGWVLLTGVCCYMAVYWPLNRAVRRRISLGVV